VRFLASMPGLIYAKGPAGAVYVNLYVSSETSIDLGGRTLTLNTQSEMPWGGSTTITTSTAGDVKASMKLRVPGWARNQPVPGGLYSYANKSAGQTTITVNGRAVPSIVDKSGYVSIDRVWQNGDAVHIAFPMDPRRVVADERVKETRGRVAIERGPVVYCAEAPDVKSGAALNAAIDPKTALVVAPQAGPDKTLGDALRIRTESLSLIPYHLWANRGVGEMTVWLRTRDFQPGDVGPSGGFVFYVNPNAEKDGWRYLEAAPFDQSAGAKWGCFRTAIAGARGTAVGTGRQNTLDMLAACPDAETAAHLCANLSVNGVKGWFLPSRDELVLMYKNLRATGAADFGDSGRADNFSYWASSQLTADMAAHIDFADLGRAHFDDKDFPRRVRAIRAF
jgi:uncharacterized protein